MIKVLFFAQLREQVGTDRYDLDSDIESISNVADLFERLASEFPILNEIKDSQRCLCAVNQTLVEFSEQVKDGDEIAFFPPVTGG